MIIYLLRSVFCLAILLLVYLLFLEKEKMHRFNRWYLLGSIVFACTIPLVSFDVSEGSLPVLQNDYVEIIVSGYNQPNQTIKVQKESVDYFTPSLWIIYLLGASLLLIRFARNFYKVLSSAKKNNSLIYENARLILLKERTASYSFLNNIFISEKDYADHAIEAELLAHELAHVKQKHSLDVIFIELLQVIFWFNPIFILYKKAIQRNHEYLADDAVIHAYGNVPGYQHLLLDKISAGPVNYMASSFSYSATKKRLVMMTRTTNKRISLLKQIAVLPLLAAAMFLFSSKTAIAQDKLVDAKAVIETPAKPKAPWMQVGLGQTPFTKEGVSPAVFAKYKAFEKKFENVKPKSDFPSIAEDEKDEMEAIFKKMSREQQKDCQVYFLPPLGPSKAEHPKQADLNRWAKSKLYGVLIDGEKIQNEELANYSPADFSSFGVGLKLKEEFRKKFGYTYEVLLTSNEAFRKYNAARRANKRFEMVISFSRRDEKIKEFQTIK